MMEDTNQRALRDAKAIQKRLDASHRWFVTTSIVGILTLFIYDAMVLWSFYDESMTPSFASTIGVMILCVIMVMRWVSRVK